MNLAISDSSIIFSGITAFLIGCLIGIVGMMGMYSIYPDIVMPEPTCECPIIHESYDRTRQTFSAFGWFFSGIPLLIWKIKVSKDINKKALQSFQKVDEK